MSKEFLAKIVHYRTYAKYLPEEFRRETREETIKRNMDMHVRKFPHLAEEIGAAYSQVYANRVVPSMRSFQFAGEAIERRNNRMFNCSFINITKYRDFADLFYMSMSGVGVGFSVKKRHINSLPVVAEGSVVSPYIIADSAEGWCDSLLELFRNPDLQFDYTNIRPMGTALSTGGTASGPKALIKMHANVRAILRKAVGRQLTPFECHRICCLIADCVVVGGVRRGALISLFDYDEEELVNCKAGAWWDKYPELARANNSAVLSKDDGEFASKANYIIQACFDGGQAEPGLSLTNNDDMGFNPCLTGDTLVAVADGRNAVSIKQLAEENFTGPVYTIQNKTVVVGHCSRAWKTRKDAAIVKVTLDDGSSFRCTGDHKIMLRTGNYIPAGSLRCGDSLMPFNSYKRSDRDYRMIASNTGRDYAQYRHIAGYYDIFKTGRNEQHIHHKDGNGLNDCPDNLEAIDGCEHNKMHVVGKKNPIHNLKNRAAYHEKRGASIMGHKNPNSYGSTADELLSKIYYATLSKGSKLKHSEVMEACGVKYLSKGRLKAMGVVSISELQDRSLTNMNHKVVSVENCGNEDVYDLTVDVTHNFAIITSTTDTQNVTTSGVFVHNCHEIALMSMGVCNLTEINAAQCLSKNDWLQAVEAATIIGTLQATYTDFKYVQPEWKKNADDEALLGVSITGQAEAQAVLTEENLREGAELAVKVNKEWANKLGIKPAKRVTTTKPSGTSSSWLGTTAGVHAGHEVRYIRRVRMDKFSALAKALAKKFPAFVVEDPFNSNDMIMQIPVKLYDTTLLRSQETAVQCLERVKKLYDNWIVPGHITGDNTHNISLTINYHEHEKEAIKRWMIENRDSYYGISLIPYDGGDYKYLPYSQPPHAEVFEILDKAFSQIAENFSFEDIKERKDNTDFKGEIACAGGACTID